MATKYRRISVTLTPELDEALGRLSSAMKMPLGSVARLFLVELVPTLNELAGILEAGGAAEANERARELVDRIVRGVEQLRLPGEGAGR